MSAGRLNILLKTVPGFFPGNRPDAPQALRAGRTASAARHGKGACAGAAGRGLVLPAAKAGLALLILVLLFFPGHALSATTGDQIINRATLSTLEFPPVTTSVTATFVTRTKSTVEFLKYAPGTPGATGVPVATTDFRNAAGTFIALAPPVTAGTQTPIDLSQPVPLIPFSTFHEGEPVFVRVTDLDQNLDPTRAETVLVTVTDATTGDSETLRLTETGPNTGVFTGYLQTSSAASVANDGQLSVVQDSSISAHYVDVVDGSDSSATAALVDPFGLVFDSATGKPVDGAKVELLNADGTPATVLGDDGIKTNSFPNSVLSGSTASDSEGRIYSFNPGGYRFPFVAPGSYILRVTPPASYSSPSTVSTTKLQVLSGGPFTILADGSFGKVFSVPTGPAIRVDVPVDPRVGSLWLTKIAGQASVSAGEYLSYDVTLENTDAAVTVFSAVVTDTLPPGFRYRKGPRA